MKLRSRKLTAATVALAAMVPATAGAIPPLDGHRGYVLNAPGENANGQSLPALTCGKDYSRNSVDGNYCVTHPATATPSSAPVRSTPAKVVVSDSGFAWGDAGAGAGTALALVLIGAGTTAAVRRRRTPSRPAVSR